MIFRKMASALGVGVILVSAVPGVLAAAPMSKEGRFDFTLCFAGKIDHMVVGKDIGSGSYDLAASIYANGELKAFHRTAARCVGTYVTIRGKFSDAGYCVVTDEDNDKWLMKYATDIGTDYFHGRWEAVEGSGKYEGMTATGEYKTLGTTPAAQPGGLQGCNHNSGTYKLR
jgi:hypothetical protein